VKQATLRLSRTFTLKCRADRMHRRGSGHSNEVGSFCSSPLTLRLTNGFARSFPIAASVSSHENLSPLSHLARAPDLLVDIMLVAKGTGRGTDR
jgi:hypothetical protein